MTTRPAAARGSGPGWRLRRWSAVAVWVGALGAVLGGSATTQSAPTQTTHSPPSLAAAATGPTTPAPVRSLPAPTPVGMVASAPVRVVVPAIGVDSDLMALGLNPDGTMEVPPGAFPAGWYTGAPTPGELGPAVLAGHVDWGGQHGVFHDLGALLAGDLVTVTRADASVATFRVVDVQEYPKDAFPTAAVYGDTVGPELRLITCGGDFDRATGHYVDNIVAYAVFEPGLSSPGTR